jgi:MATE family multidrug resistance protein
MLLRLVRLAAAVAFARLGMMGMGVVDTIVVGQIAPGELAHQALGWAPTGVLLMGAIGLLTGVQVLSAAAVGAGAPHEAGAALKRGLVICLAAGAAAVVLTAVGAKPLFLAFGVNAGLAAEAADVAVILSISVPLHLAFVAASFFMEGIERPQAATWVMWIANGLNMGLNLWLVPEHGAEGSAWATVLARIFLAAALLIWVWSMRDAPAFGLCHARGARAVNGFRPLLSIGWAAALSQLAESGAFSGMTVIAARLSDQAVAAYQILLNLLAIVFMIALGFAAASSVLTSESLAAGRRRDSVRAGWLALNLNTACMILCGLLMIAFAGAIARAYTPDAVIGAVIIAGIGMTAAALVPDGAQVVLAQTLRARRDNWFPTASHIFAYVVVMPPLAFVLAERMGRGVTGLLEAILVASALSAAVLVLRLRWLTRRESSLPPP